MKKVKFRDLEVLVYRLQLTYDEIIYRLVIKYRAGSTIGYTLPRGVHETSDFNLMLKSLLPNKVKVNITVDDTRLKSNLNTKKYLGLLKNLLFIQN